MNCSDMQWCCWIDSYLGDAEELQETHLVRLSDVLSTQKMVQYQSKCEIDDDWLWSLKHNIQQRDSWLDTEMERLLPTIIKRTDKAMHLRAMKLCLRWLTMFNLLTSICGLVTGPICTPNPNTRVIDLAR